MTKTQETTKGLQVFNYEAKEVRTFIIEDKPWFVAKDVCDILSITNPTKALARLDDDERSNLKLGRQGDTNIVNEYGLYSLVLTSRKPEAKAFKRWITHEVIPSIAHHGAYMTPETIEKALTDPDFIIKLATQLKEEQAKNLEYKAKIDHLQPKADIYDQVMNKEDTFTITEVATSLGLSAAILFKILRDTGWLKKEAHAKHQVTRQAPKGTFKIIKGMFGEQIRVTSPGYNKIATLITHR